METAQMLLANPWEDATTAGRAAAIAAKLLERRLL